MALKTLTRSFAGGELAPELYGRIDLDKYQTGLSTCRNYITLPHGPAQNRPGFAYINETKFSNKQSNLIEFSYSTEQTYILEIGDQYVRFHTNGATLLETPKTIGSIVADTVNLTAHGFTAGKWVYIGTRYYIVATAATDSFTVTNLDGTAGAPSGSTAAQVYEVATPYLEADVFNLHYVQSADVLTIVHPGYAPRELKRLGATNWTLTTITFAPTIQPPANADAVATGTGTVGYRYQITAVASDGLEESVASPANVNITASVTAITKANPGVITTAAVHGLSVEDMVYVAGIGGMTQLTDGYYLVNTAPSTTSLSLKTIAGVVVNTTAYTTYTSGGTIKLQAVGALNNLATTGQFNTITWATVAGALRYNVYKERNGLFGYAGQTTAATFKDDNITADTTRTPPESVNPFSGTGNYPGAVSYFEQRRCFGGTDNKPQNLWMTRSATESNMNYSVPTQDDDAINLRVVAREVNRIRHILPLSELILLTSSGEWKVTAQNSDAITPASVAVRPQAFNGATNVQPVMTGSSAVYVRAQSSRVFDLTYSWEANAFKPADLSLLAPHLVDSYTLTDMALTRTPTPVIWCVRNDGTLLGLTYMPDQKVQAWHRHDTDGSFESIAAVSENGIDVLYATVRRTINGRTVRYVERMADRRFETLANSFIVDSGVTYSGSPVTTLSGLWHLEGKTVSILADGAVVPQQVVSAGAITLPQAASIVHIGLAYTSDIATLPLVIEGAQGIGALGQGMRKNLNKVYLRVFESSGINVGPDTANLTAYKQRTAEPYGSAPDWVTDEIEVAITPKWGQSGQVAIRQTDPLPMTILSMVMEVATGG